HWNQALMLETAEPLNAQWLESALEHLLSHHDGLRLRFNREAEGWRQNNEGVNETVPLMIIDLSDLAPAEQNRRMQIAAAEIQSSLNLSSGSLLRAAKFDLGAGIGERLLIAIHHLVVDGVSWRILLEDLQMAYRQASRGEAIKLAPKTTSFKQWAE